MRFCKFAVCFVLFVGAFVQAHSQTQIRVNVPFDFTVGNHSLPAGQYEVSTVWDSNNLVWRVNNHQGQTAVLATNSLSSQKADHECSFLFRKIGGEYSLVQFWLGGRSGREVVRPKIANTVVAQADYVQIAAER
jgi:hypothetical protein